MPILPFNGVTPRLAEDVFVAPGAVIIGDVSIGPGSSIWCNAVLRGDAAPIVIGAGANIQDNAVIHADPDAPCTIGDGVTVGHAAVVHGCTIGDNSLIGMHATILNHAVIAPESLVAASALVRERSNFPPRALIAGVPAEQRRELSDAHVAGLYQSAEDYRRRAAAYRAAGLDQRAAAEALGSGTAETPAATRPA
jgi:carbonic anhydrase/acetyltransferase-like protein (isoleucine patch superfamily)